KRKSKYKAIRKRSNYIHNMIDDLQWKICHWLLSKFRKIIISRLYVARTNKQGKETQADLRLCGFVDRLIHKSLEYNNSEIHVCKEHHTSQACTKCLSLNTVKDTTVRCKDCKHEIHRDLNGARNIFLKHCK
ncbi:MAG: zinc ribbon domain-containing protein, partial [Cetobacterium sp.]